MKSFSRAVLLGLLLLIVSSQCDGMRIPTYIFMHVKRLSTNESIQVCANFYPNRQRPGALPPAFSLEEARQYQFALWDHDDTFCTPLPPNMTFEGAMIQSFLHFDNWSSASGGACSEPIPMAIRIDRLQKHNVSAALFVTTPDLTHASYYDPTINRTRASIPIYFIDAGTYQIVSKFVDRSMPFDYEFSFFLKEEPFVELGSTVLALLATICITLGGLWSGHRRKIVIHGAPGSSCSRNTSDMSSVNADSSLRQGSISDKPRDNVDGHGEIEPAATPFNWCMLGIICMFITIQVLLIYFFFDIFAWVVIVFYVFAASASTCACIWFFLKRVPYGTCSFRTDPLGDYLTRICRCVCWKKTFNFSVQYRKAALYSVCAATAITWCILRHKSYAWILHDFLASCLSIVLIRNWRMPNLKWITIFLTIVTIYDVFMVFITPLFTRTGCSVMVDMATGGACSRDDSDEDALYNLPPSNATTFKEEMPVLLRMPRFSDPMWTCYRMEVDQSYPPTILGLGDIIVPGVLVGYSAAFSMAWNIPGWIYFVVAVIGYIGGIIATVLVLNFTKLAQPALIYLIPCTLIPTHITALLRREWGRLWRGDFPVPDEYRPILANSTTASDTAATSSTPTTATTDNAGSVGSRSTSPKRNKDAVVVVSTA